MDIGIAYPESVPEALDIMRKVGAAMRRNESLRPLLLEDLQIAGVERLDDSAVVLRCRFKVAPLAQSTVKRAYLQRIKAAFDQRGVEIPVPHVTVYAGTSVLSSQAPQGA
jgi:small-conductance mechanosensitive channel